MPGMVPSSSSPFVPPRSRGELGWPTRVLPSNLSARLSGGLARLYAGIDPARKRPRDTREHVTTAEGLLDVHEDMPLLARRYRYVRTLSESSLSQIIVVADTYRACAPAADGCRPQQPHPLVAVKILNAQHWLLGAQEYERMRLLQVAQERSDIDAGIAVALAHFELDAHFCIVIALMQGLGAGPVHGGPSALPAGPSGASRPTPPQPPSICAAGAAPANGAPADGAPVGAGPAGGPTLGLAALRALASQLLGSLAFLRAQGVLHSDIKPENILCDASDAGGAANARAGPSGASAQQQISRGRLIDFSNAMTLDETSAYYDTYDVQTLGYRAPEVIVGRPFSHAIDTWSLGVTLAELYSGRPFVQAASRGGLVIQLAQLLGRPPPALLAGSKYGAELAPLVAHTPTAHDRSTRRAKLAAALRAPPTRADQLFMDLLATMLAYDADERPTPAAALGHPFFAPVFPFGIISATEAGARVKEEDAPGKGRAARESESKRRRV